MRKPKPIKITHPEQRAFLMAYRNSGNIRAATDAAGVVRQTYYYWTEHDAAFTLAAQVAKEEYGDMLEAKLTSMALREGNVQALITALKMAGRFREVTRNELTGVDDKPLTIRVEYADAHAPATTQRPASPAD